MNYTEMLFNRDERLVNLLNQADSKNLELIEEINNREEEIERLNNIINELEKWLWEERYKHNGEYVLSGRKAEEVYTLILDKLQELKGSDKG